MCYLTFVIHEADSLLRETHKENKKIKIIAGCKKCNLAKNKDNANNHRGKSLSTHVFVACP